MTEHNNKSGHLINGFGLFIAMLITVSFWTSCGKENSSPAGYNSQLAIVNASIDDTKIDLYTDNIKRNSSPYLYGSTPTYTFLSEIGLPLQLRMSTGNRKLLITDTNTTRRNAKYTLFLTGAGADKSLQTIFTVDSTITKSKVGSGKLRFLNAAIRSNALDVWANGSKLFSAVSPTKYSDWLELPAGNYDIKIYRQGDQTTLLYEINPLTVSDSKLYTMYTYGIINRTDSTQFNAKVITNK